MPDGLQSPGSDAMKSIFYDRSELRAGWRLLIFLAIVVTLIRANRLVVGRLLYGVDATTSFLVFEVMDFLIFLFASWIMARIEARTIADYLQGDCTITMVKPE